MWDVGEGPLRVHRGHTEMKPPRIPGHPFGGNAEGESRRRAQLPEVRGPEGTSPCSTPRSVASSTGRKTFILEEAGSRLGLAMPRKALCSRETRLVGGRPWLAPEAWCPTAAAGRDPQLRAVGREHRVVALRPNLPPLRADPSSSPGL